MERFDIDTTIAENDIGLFYSDEQHIIDTISSQQGCWPEHTADGVSILSYLNSTGKSQEIARKINIQLSSDLYQVGDPSVKVEGSKITIYPDATI